MPAYAATIHKSQGSEYPAVVIPLMTQHYAMLQRNLLYTGVTRGKRLVVLVGQKKAVAIAVRNVSGRQAVVEAGRVAAFRLFTLPADRHSGLRKASPVPAARFRRLGHPAAGSFLLEFTAVYKLTARRRIIFRADVTDCSAKSHFRSSLKSRHSNAVR